jgi:hypothetical protein
MAALTDYLENALLNEVLRNVGYTPAATVYLALFTTATSDAGGGTEVTGGSYARQAITFSAASGGATENSGAVTFAGMPAATVTHAAIYDALTAGNMLFHGALSASQVVAGGASLVFAAGAIDASLA